MGIRWQTPPEEAFLALADAYIGAINDALFALAQRRAPEIEAWLKANARWIDRTGNARQTLFAEAEKLVQGAAINLGDGMEYFLWLELAHGGTYAIIGPAIDFWGPVLWNDVKELLR